LTWKIRVNFDKTESGSFASERDAAGIVQRHCPSRDQVPKRRDMEAPKWEMLR
jgi:hypothetical protein